MFDYKHVPTVANKVNKPFFTAYCTSKQTAITLKNTDVLTLLLYIEISFKKYLTKVAFSMTMPNISPGLEWFNYKNAPNGVIFILVEGLKPWKGFVKEKC